MCKKKIFIDMDGVLAKWNTEASFEDTFEKGYFLNRLPQENMITAVRELSHAFDITILTQVYPEGTAIEEKKAWLKKYDLDHIPVVFVPYGHRKRDYIELGEDEVLFLVDDYTKNLIEWESEDDYSYGIKFLNGINDTHETFDGLRISAAMSAKSIRVMLTSLFRYIG